MRLIDADALVAQMEADAEHMEDPIAKMLTYAAISDIKHAPTIDPSNYVIRCKDCEYWSKRKYSLQGRCALSGYHPTGSWHCGNAKARDVELKNQQVTDHEEYSNR